MFTVYLSSCDSKTGLWDSRAQTVSPDALKGRRSVMMAYAHGGTSRCLTVRLRFPVLGDDRRPGMTAAAPAPTGAPERLGTRSRPSGALPRRTCLFPGQASSARHASARSCSLTSARVGAITHML